MKEKKQNYEFNLTENQQLIEDQFNSELEVIMNKESITMEKYRFKRTEDSNPCDTIYTNLYACLKKC